MPYSAINTLCQIETRATALPVIKRDKKEAACDKWEMPFVRGMVNKIMGKHIPPEHRTTGAGWGRVGDGYVDTPAEFLNHKGPQMRGQPTPPITVIPKKERNAYFAGLIGLSYTFSHRRQQNRTIPSTSR